LPTWATVRLWVMNELSPADQAQAIGDARQRLTSFVQQCPEDDWTASPVEGDPRPVGVIADHVADAYEYLAGWVRDLIAGRPVDVNAAVVDDLNAEHARGAATVSPAEVMSHLRSSGDALIALIAGLEPGQLDLDEGRVRRLAVIAARHADNHRAEIEAALTASASPA
jgi:DinB superfamily